MGNGRKSLLCRRRRGVVVVLLTFFSFFYLHFLDITATFSPLNPEKLKNFGPILLLDGSFTYLYLATKR